MKKGKNHILEGPLWKSLLFLSVPIILANLLQTAYQLTDMFWVGRLGADAVAAISISFPLMFLILSLGGGLVMAGTILVAQYKGKNDKKATDHVASQTLLMAFFVAVTLAIIGYSLSPLLISLMGAEPNVFTSAVSYLRISFIGVIFIFGYMIYQSLMRGIGEVKIPLYLVLISVLLNLVFDPLFIFGWGFIPAMGVSGAAIATILCQGFAALIGMFMLFSGKYGIHIKKENLKPDFKLISKMFRLGLPSSIEQSTRAIGLTLMTFLVARFGTEIIASYGIGSRILSLVIIPALGISIANSTLVGQNLGAKNIKRAEKSTNLSLIIGFLALTVIGVIFFIFAEQIATLFIPGDQQVIKMSSFFLRIVALTFGFISLFQVSNSAFRAAGNTVVPMTISIASLFVFQFPVAYVLAFHTSLAETGIWISFPVSYVLSGIVALIWLSKGSWKNKKLTEEIKLAEKAETEFIIEEGI